MHTPFAQRKLHFGLLLALALMFGMGYVAAAQGGETTISFNHYGDGLLIAGGELSVTAPETIGADHTFLYWMVNGQQVNGRTLAIDMSSGASVQAIYNPLNVPVTIRLQDGSGNLIASGGSLRYHDGSWHDLPGNGDGTWTLTDTDATAVTCEMTYNNGRQTFSNLPTSQTVVTFETVATTVALEDTAHAPLTDGGTVRFHQLGWQDFGAANTTVQLLPGSYTFEMTYNNGRQTFSNYTITAAPTQ
ncbi:MAG: hypothetical protein KC425_06230, partial [Anaerolineales bacterium]|nr:hypothetical protein [Anaerolineales bacterium]